MKDDLDETDKRVLALLLEKRDLMQRKVDVRNKRKRIKEERRRNGEQVSDTDSESEPDLYRPIFPAEFSDSDEDPPQAGGVNGGASTAIAV